MRIILLAAFTTCLYATHAVLAETKFGRSDALAAVFFTNGSVAAYAAIAIILKILVGGEDAVAVLPSWKQAATMSGAGLVLFLGACVYFYTLQIGGSATTIATLLALIPIPVKCFRYLITGNEPPTILFFAGCLLAAAGVYIVLNDKGTTTQ